MEGALNATRTLVFLNEKGYLWEISQEYEVPFMELCCRYYTELEKPAPFKYQRAVFTLEEELEIADQINQRTEAGWNTTDAEIMDMANVLGRRREYNFLASVFRHEGFMERYSGMLIDNEKEVDGESEKEPELMWMLEYVISDIKKDQAIAGKKRQMFEAVKQSLRNTTLNLNRNG
ncbi:hypothetical protein Cantr_00942 [Candida viswanathii]|uniref:Uncharacterized protein n=1 Tax=Candida viswanathii TaxID=5486 RepID=A0A367YJX3_9ASCO|nr:hypothetical protein Cantr_00942 [Candida viswanathii]